MATPVATETTVVGSRQRFYTAPQPTAGTLVAPLGSAPAVSAGGPLRVLTSTIGVTQSQEPHGFAKDTTREFIGSTYRTIREIVWTISTRIHPPPNFAGTLVPEPHHLLVAVFGRAAAFNDGTSLIYRLGDKRLGTRVSLGRLVNFDDGIYGEWIFDAIPNSWKFAWSGGEPPTFEFSGEAAGHIVAGKSTVNGAVTADPAVIVDHAAFEVGSVLMLGTDGPHAVTAVSADGLTLTMDADITVGDGATVQPSMPDPTYATQSALGAVDGSITIGGVEVPASAFEITVDNGTEYEKNQIGAAAMTDGVPTEQTVTGTISLRATESEVRSLISRRSFPTFATVLNMGPGTAGVSARLSVPRCLPNLENLSFDSGLGTVSVPFRAMDSVEGAADALTLTYS